MILIKELISGIISELGNLPAVWVVGRSNVEGLPILVYQSVNGLLAHIDIINFASNASAIATTVLNDGFTFPRSIREILLRFIPVVLLNCPIDMCLILRISFSFVNIIALYLGAKITILPI